MDKMEFLVGIEWNFFFKKDGFEREDKLQMNLVNDSER